MSQRLCIVVMLIILAVVQPGWASEFRGGETVSIPTGSTLNDDLYAFASNVNIAGRVTGDVVASGGELSLPGVVTQDATIAGGTINVAGRVGDDLRAAGGDINVSGSVADNALIAGGTIILSNTSRVSRDLQVTGGDLHLAGNIGRNLNASGGKVTIDGTVGGTARVNAGQITIGPGAVIRGDLVYTSSKRANIASGARILGRTIYQPTPARHRRAAPLFKFLFWLLSFVALYLVGVVVIALAPRNAEHIADRAITAPWVSILVGFILIIVIPAVILALMLTLIGIPLGFILLTMYLITLYLSRIYVALAIGRLIFRRQVSPYLGLLVGLLILWVLKAIPFLGWLIGFIAVLLGLGALAAQRYNLMKSLRQEGKI